MKATIYDLAEFLVSRGAKFHIDLKKRNLIINGKYIIKNGEYNTKRFLHNIQFEEATLDETLEKLDDLFVEYHHSRPTERSMSHQRNYFKALKERDLSDLDMMYAPVRDLAQLRLELALLVFILKGEFKWDEEICGKWFWQSSAHKDFVILREWVEPNIINI